MRKRLLAAVVFFICVILSIISYYLWDIPLTQYSKGLGSNIRGIAEIVTTFGVTTWYLIISALFYLFFTFLYKNKIYAARFLFLFTSLSISGLVVILIKWLGGRYRPVEYFTHGSFGFGYLGYGYELTSFPSGHTQTIFALATVIILLFPRWGIPAFVLALLVSASRIILTSHYLSDVIAGAGIGILITLAVKYFFDRQKIRLNRK